MMNYRNFMDEYGFIINIIMIIFILSYAIHNISTLNAKINICESLGKGYVKTFDTCVSCEELNGQLDYITGECLISTNNKIYMTQNGTILQFN